MRLIDVQAYYHISFHIGLAQSGTMWFHSDPLFIHTHECHRKVHIIIISLPISNLYCVHRYKDTQSPIPNPHVIIICNCRQMRFIMLHEVSFLISMLLSMLLSYVTVDK